MNLAAMNNVLKCVYSEPKFRAQIEWHAEYSAGAQLHRQVPRLELEHYVATGQHPNPQRRVEIVLYAEPEWDWWEPRYDQPGRREAARRREFGIA